MKKASISKIDFSTVRRYASPSASLRAKDYLRSELQFVILRATEHWFANVVRQINSASSVCDFLYVLPVLQPLIVCRQLSPHFIDGPLQLGSLVQIELAAFLGSKGDVVNLLDANKPRDRCCYGRVAEDIADSQTCELIVLLRVWAVRRAVTLE